MNLPPDLIPVLNLYREGKFLMAENRDSSEVYVYDPHMRGQIPIADLHVSKKLKKTILKAPYRVSINENFVGVIDGCANRSETWINDTIRNIFIYFHGAGLAHSIECWDGDDLVGGLYGLALGGLFCGESMFSTKTDASKIALVHLCARLHHAGFTVLDSQFTTPHLEQFGAYEIPRDEYLKRIQDAQNIETDFCLPGISEGKLITEFLNS